VTRVSAVVFDLDGTLVDSLGDIAAALNHALAAYSLPELGEDEIRGYVGDGASALCARAARLAPTAAELAPLLAEFLARYTAHATVKTELVPGARELLRALGRTLPLALLTNKPRRTTDAVLAGLDLARHFQVVIAGDDLPEKKPDPAPLRAIAARLGLGPESLVMVGDGPQDIECGRAAGARTVGVLGGFVPEARLLASEPDRVIASLAELEDAIRDFAHATSK
jgi:phosphoglycolate phosphatase